MKTTYFFFALIVIAGVASSARAHAFLETSTPKVGSTVMSSPKEVIIHFDDDIQADKSSIQVFNVGGTEVDKKNAHPPTDATDKATLVVSLPTLTAGVYKVTWHAMCPDGHKTEGSFQFTLKAGG